MRNKLVIYKQLSLVFWYISSKGLKYQLNFNIVFQKLIWEWQSPIHLKYTLAPIFINGQQNKLWEMLSFKSRGSVFIECLLYVKYCARYKLR